MDKTTVALLGGLAGVAVGVYIGIAIARQGCKDAIVGGAVDAVKQLGGGPALQSLAGSLVGGLVASN